MTRSPSTRVASRSVPVPSMASMALSMRLVHTWLSSAAYASIGGMSGPKSRSTVDAGELRATSITSVLSIPSCDVDVAAARLGRSASTTSPPPTRSRDAVGRVGQLRRATAPASMVRRRPTQRRRRARRSDDRLATARATLRRRPTAAKQRCDLPRDRRRRGPRASRRLLPHGPWSRPRHRRPRIDPSARGASGRARGTAPR